MTIEPLLPAFGVPLLLTGRFLYWAVAFGLLAIISALVGLRGVAGISWAIARLFVVVFLVLFVLSLIF